MEKLKEWLIDILLFICAVLAIILIPLSIIIIGLVSLFILAPFSFILNAIFGKEN